MGPDDLLDQQSDELEQKAKQHKLKSDEIQNAIQVLEAELQRETQAYDINIANYSNKLEYSSEYEAGSWQRQIDLETSLYESNKERINREIDTKKRQAEELNRTAQAEFNEAQHKRRQKQAFIGLSVAMDDNNRAA